MHEEQKTRSATPPTDALRKKRAPTLYAMMLADPACTPENGSKRLRWCVSAAEALPEHVGTEWKKRFGVDILDGLRLRQDQEVVIASDIAMEIRKTLPSKCGLVVLEALNHGAHGAVEHQNALAGGGEQGGSLRRNRNIHRIRRLSVRHWDGCPANG